MINKRLLQISSILCFLVVCSCSTSNVGMQELRDFSAATVLPDYSRLDYWAAHPWKADPSDKVPKALQKNYSPDSAVDIFFLHPTTYTDRQLPYGWNAPIDNEEINAKTDGSAILYQASIFNAAGRVFAPRYRQANYHAYFNTDTATALAVFDLAYTDIKTAFLYYLQHYNNNRPFIIAAHSQGTTHAKRLIKEVIESSDLKERMVSAYLVGMPIEPDWFATLKPCTTPEATGCYCSWRTFREGHTDSFVQKEKYIAVVTNPLTWDSSKPAASRQSNNGAVLRKFSKLKPHVAGATVHEGVLWTPRPRFFGNIFFTNTNYHIGDYNLYYLSVRENARQRINAYLKK